MKRIIISGCNGTMGRVVAASINERDDCTVVAGLDAASETTPANFKVFTDPSACNEEFDVIIDFSNPMFLSALLKFAIIKKKPVVIATTGYAAEQIAEISAAAQSIPLFFSANMSIGVNLITELAKKAASILGRQFDIEIIEKHHNKKIDAPSGTALMIANAISDSLPANPEYIYDRHSKRGKRAKNEIGLHSVRGGTIVGEHEIIFAGRDEIVTISHIAMSKQIFANGAINAALFVCDKQSGIYNMSDLI